MRTEISAVVLFFGPPLLVFWLLDWFLGPIIVVFAFYVSARAIQSMQNRYYLRQKENDHERRNRRNLY